MHLHYKYVAVSKITGNYSTSLKNTRSKFVEEAHFYQGFWNSQRQQLVTQNRDTRTGWIYGMHGLGDKL